MKKILSLIIVFLFFFGLFSDAFAMETNSVDIDDFSTFSIEQVQNTFSNSLSQQQSTDNKTEKQAGKVLAFADTDYSIPTFFVINFVFGSVIHITPNINKKITNNTLKESRFFPTLFFLLNFSFLNNT